MSQENVEIAKRFSALLARGEVDAALELVAEAVVVTNLAGPLAQPQVFCGREAALAHWTRHAEIPHDLRLVVDDWIDAGEWVIHVTRWKGRAEISEEVDGGYGTNASRFRGGKLVESIGYSRPGIAALEAVGCRSSPPPG
jgi:ketosteroid isomerase-like protein